MGKRHHALLAECWRSRSEPQRWFVRGSGGWMQAGRRMGRRARGIGEAGGRRAEKGQGGGGLEEAEVHLISNGLLRIRGRRRRPSSAAQNLNHGACLNVVIVRQGRVKAGSQTTYVAPKHLEKHDECGEYREGEGACGMIPVMCRPQARDTYLFEWRS